MMRIEDETDKTEAFGICKICGRWFDKSVSGSEEFCIDCVKNIRKTYGDKPPRALGGEILEKANQV